MPQKRRGKPKAVRQEILLDYLRRRIITGALLPGHRLPTHKEVQEKFRTTRVTVQRAFDQLVEDGFIRTEPKIGRFVADRPPHLNRYALVFPSSPHDGEPWTWTRYHNAIIEASRSVAAQDGISFAVYHNVNAHADSEGYQALMRDMDSHRLAGVCFAFSPHDLQVTPLMERTDVPRMTLLGGVDIPSREVDTRQFLYRSLNYLLADGRRHLAVITIPGMTPDFSDEFEAAATSRGAITRPFWTQAVVPHHANWVRHAVRAILGDDSTRPPDGLVITDDHLVESTVAALLEFGVRVPKQMRVIGHWNFPLAYRGQVPIDLLGFDAREQLRAGVEAINAQRRGEAVKPLELIPARFSWELLRNTKDQKQAAGEPAVNRSVSSTIGSLPKEKRS